MAPHAVDRPVAHHEGGRFSCGAAPSWFTRQWVMWSHTLAPLRVLDAPRGRVTAWAVSWPLKRELTSAGRARRLVTAQLSDWAVGDLADVAELLVSELVTNALRHTRGPLRLNLRLLQGGLLCEVEDTGSGAPVRSVVDPDAEGGRGTELIDMLADAWGSTRTATGKTVWFELRSADRFPSEAGAPESRTVVGGEGRMAAV
ncbi:ATP-binding protein [Streptomyces sp. NPDC018610]|uniref:ATP-binding protein n=1 Tax=Streptomyces sp. NPDC018610 TaxID=3365049 RepID=UPI00379E34E8